MPTEPLDRKFEAFGFHVIKLKEGNDPAAASEALRAAAEVTGKPVVILAATVKGKGVSFMENNADWHGKAPNDAQFAAAMAELKAGLEKLEEN
ncbi:1-deoxy-D-xylulose-5-phosphate synthase [bioreactor metagenome]|uniref:1-deoxy-D-xylulose-5-phosphate synthase n=1 Tax=bioreactor metagenome TaxID=1076179 RepID=A0A645JDF2_9ZZZZ